MDSLSGLPLRRTAAALSLLFAAAAPAQDLLVHCERLVVAPDTVVAPGELLLRDGKVVHVGKEIPAELRASARHAHFAGATITPGFVLAHSTLQRDQDLVERATAMTPALRAAEAFDPFQKELLALPKYAVTSCALSPASANVAGGIAALVEPGSKMGDVAVDAAYARFSLAAAARSPEREPTSLMGAVDLLRQALLTARSGKRGGPDQAALAAVLAGQRRAVVHCDTRAEILAALALAREFQIEPVLLGARDAADALDAIAAARATLALWPLQPTMRDAQLRLPAELETRGIAFCFVGEPQELRASAAIAVHHGTSRQAALAALTRTAAAICAAGDTHGALRRGCDADFAVWSGDPLDLASRLIAVYGDGVQLFGAPPSTTAPATTPALAGKESL